MKRIPIAGPWITEKERAYVADAVANAWYEQHALYHDRFERAFADYLGVRHAMCLPSCTSAIHLALAALGVGPGDEVIVPDLTWIASAAPITYLGATPVFADVDRTTWCLSAEAFERAITPRTKAVIPVDLYGGMPDYAALTAVASARGIAVIEDAAEAHGSAQGGRRAGAFGEAGVFSFHGSKTLTTGEGGMLVTDRTDLYERAIVLRDHGRVPGDPPFYNREVAFKYKMSSMQAALGLAQLERIEELVAKKREIFRWYREELPGVELNAEAPGTTNSYWMVTLIVPGIAKQTWATALAAAGIDSRPVFYPLSALPAYAHLPRAATPVAHEIGEWGINLPSALMLERADVARVGETVRAVIERNR